MHGPNRPQQPMLSAAAPSSEQSPRSRERQGWAAVTSTVMTMIHGRNHIWLAGRHSAKTEPRVRSLLTEPARAYCMRPWTTLQRT